AAVDMVDRNVAEGRGDKAAFIDPARRITYGELADGCARVGPMLARLGLQREDRVAMIMLDTVDFPVLFWGGIRAGVIPIPLNTLLPVEQFRYILQDSRAKALFVSPPFLQAAEPAAARLATMKSIVVVGEGPERFPNFRKLLSAETPATPVETSADEVSDLRSDAARAADVVLRRADALCADPRGRELHAGYRLEAAALVRLGGRGAA